VAVAVVFQELVPTIAFDQQQVEIAIVIGVEQRAIDRGAPPRRPRGERWVTFEPFGLSRF